MVTTELPLISLVIPAFNEEENLPELFRRVGAVAAGLAGFRFEFLLIDNCSTDGTQRLGCEQSRLDPRWKYLRFSRNFGFEVSMTAGLHFATGDAVIFMPSDMQDPPELIPRMIEKWGEGNCDVVYGRLTSRQDGNFLKTLGAAVAYRLLYVLSDIQIPPGATDFRLISRRAVEAIKQCGERNRYMRGLCHWVGFRQVSFEYERAPRTRGRSSAGILFCLNLAISSLVAFSTKPLRWASLFGFFCLVGSVLAGVTYGALTILVRAGVLDLVDPMPGWTTQLLLTFAFGGIQCLFLGIMGEYLGRIYGEVKQRPLWVVDVEEGFGAEARPRKDSRPVIQYARPFDAIEDSIPL